MWVQIKDQEIDKAIRLLEDKLPELAKRLAKEKAAMKAPNREAIIEAAELKYSEEGNDREITVDPDAVLSHSEKHVFVMSWVYVPYAEVAGMDSRASKDDDDEPDDDEVAEEDVDFDDDD